MRKIIAVMMAIAFVFTAFGMTRNVYAEEIVGVTPSGIVYTQIGSSIDAFITEREAGLASCVVSVFDRNGVIYNGYYGYSDMENQIQADPQTVYEYHYLDLIRRSRPGQMLSQIPAQDADALLNCGELALRNDPGSKR